MKPQPRGGGDTTSCYQWHLPTAAAVPGVPTGGPGCPCLLASSFMGSSFLIQGGGRVSVALMPVSACLAVLSQNPSPRRLCSSL